MDSEIIGMVNGFRKLNPYLGTGTPLPSGWQKITDLPVLIFVGGMGVGKSTTIAKMEKRAHAFTLLPNRRVFTDCLMVAPLQRQENRPVQTLGRIQRLPYIQRYKQKYPAGMAHAISRLAVDPTQCRQLLVFDGLRGEAEVRFAVKNMPRVHFIALSAPDVVRLQRLLDRRDQYDRITSDANASNGALDESDILTFLGLPNGDAYFSDELRAFLLEIVQNERVDPDELRDKARILYEERRMYNLDETMRALQETASQRTVFIDTSTRSPAQVTEVVINSIREILSSQAS